MPEGTTQASRKKTKLIKFRCPKCGTYNVPDEVLIHKAIMQCKNCKMPYEASIKRSFSFRKLSSKLGSKPNRSPFYYTSPERKVKNSLARLDEIFFHNVGIQVGKKRYWLDFLLPFKRTVISVSPSMWHEKIGRGEADKLKYNLLSELGFNVIVLGDNEIKLHWRKLDTCLKERLEKL